MLKSAPHTLDQKIVSLFTTSKLIQIYVNEHFHYDTVCVLSRIYEACREFVYSIFIIATTELIFLDRPQSGGSKTNTAQGKLNEGY